MPVQADDFDGRVVLRRDAPGESPLDEPDEEANAHDHDAAVVAADLARRDHLDSTRDSSPLAVAEGAVVVDTTDRSVEEIVEEVLTRL